MKPEADQKSNHYNINNSNVIILPQKKAAIHDFSQILVENCLKVSHFY